MRRAAPVAGTAARSGLAQRRVRAVVVEATATGC
jgi:hypothetical protein